MILFTILMIMAIVMGVILLTTAVIAGGGFIALFGDVLMFALMIWLIVKILRRTKK